MVLDYRDSTNRASLPGLSAGAYTERFYTGALHNMVIDPAEPNAVPSESIGIGYSDMVGFSWANWRVGERKPTRHSHLNYWVPGPRPMGFHIMNGSGASTTDVAFIIDGLDQFGQPREELVEITVPSLITVTPNQAAYYVPGAAALPLRSINNDRVILSGNLTNFGEYALNQSCRGKIAWSQPCGITLVRKNNVNPADFCFPNFKTLAFGLRTRIQDLRDIVHASIHKPFAASNSLYALNGAGSFSVARNITLTRNTTPIQVKVQAIGGLTEHRHFHGGGDLVVISNATVAQCNGAWQMLDVTHSVIAATNDATIVIQTAAPHNLATGDTVEITNVGGNYLANGTWSVTVTGADTFTLDGSTGNQFGSPPFTSGGLVRPLREFSLFGTTAPGAAGGVAGQCIILGNRAHRFTSPFSISAAHGWSIYKPGNVLVGDNPLQAISYPPGSPFAITSSEQHLAYGYDLGGIASHLPMVDRDVECYAEFQIARRSQD